MLLIEDEIKNRLQGLNPTTLIVINDSGKHAGHASSPNNGQSHFTVHIESPKFDGLSRVQRQRLVMDTLGDLFERGLHALSIQAGIQA